MNEYPRIAGRVNNIVDLDVTFHHNGVPAAPFAIRRVDIFKGSIRTGNIVGQIHFPLPDHAAYPSPAVQDPANPGRYTLKFQIPSDFPTGEVYYDVWNYIGSPPIPTVSPGIGSTGTEIVTGTDTLIVDLENEAHWQSEPGQFWVFDDDWVLDDTLITKRIGFEPLDKRLRKGEVRTIEVAVHSLPHHTYDFNKLAPLIPNLQPTISFSTVHCEPIAGLVNKPCKIGVRQGHHKNTPFTIQCQIDTRGLLIGMYQYTVRVILGDEVIVSEPMALVVE